MSARSERRIACAIVVAASLALVRPASALAWGSLGHHLISRAAVDALPLKIPAFLRTPDAAKAIEALGTEADRSKGAGKTHDFDRDPGHYVDLGDDGKIAGAVDLEALPLSRRDYDTALRTTNSSQYAVGFLPYQLIDGWQQVAEDFAIYRTDVVGETKAAGAGDRAWFSTDRSRREALTIRDVGYWSHFVGDASQPLHVSIHYNGWGDRPNPNGYTTSHETHANFETAYVRDVATLPQVERAMSPLVECRCTIESYVPAYLAATNAHVVPFYELEKRGAFASKDGGGAAFTIGRLADGASALRDLIVDAYDASALMRIGYPERHTVADYEAGRAVPSRMAVGGSDS